MRELFDSYCEEMESFAAARVCKDFDIPYLSFRVISNNHINDEDYLDSTCLNSQKFAVELIKAL